MGGWFGGRFGELAKALIDECEVLPEGVFIDAVADLLDVVVNGRAEAGGLVAFVEAAAVVVAPTEAVDVADDAGVAALELHAGIGAADGGAGRR